jgi:hypothetical protein
MTKRTAKKIVASPFAKKPVLYSDVQFKKALRTKKGMKWSIGGAIDRCKVREAW